jgi:ABC-type lipoprotein release transport system permease subunit
LSLALLLASVLEATPLWPVVIWTLPVIFAFALISILYPLWQIWHIHPAEFLRAGSSISSRKAIVLGSRVGLLMPIGSLVLRNLGRSRTRTLITVLSLFLSAFLLVLMFTGILSLHQALQGTLLGDYVLLQTAVPQIAGCVIAIILTFLSVADLLLLQVRERQQEIGLLQAVGWRSGWIQRLFVQEGVTLAMIGTIPGVLVGQWILRMQHATQSILPALVVVLGAVLLMMLVAACAALPALRALSRMQVADVLRAE